jgi:hypothetical protein
MYYQSLTGSPMNAGTVPRPNLSISLGILTKLIQNPDEFHASRGKGKESTPDDQVRRLFDWLHETKHFFGSSYIKLAEFAPLAS